MRRTVLLAISLLVLSSLACGLFGRAEEAIEAGREAATRVADLGSLVDEESVATVIAQLPEEVLPEEAEEESVQPEIDADALFDLQSYRMRVTTEWIPEDGDADVNVVEESRTREPRARRMVMTSTADDFTMEFVEIDDQAWWCSAGACSQMPAEADELDDAFGAWEVFDPESIPEDASYLGSKTVNGIRTRHYALDLSAVRAALASQGGEVSDLSGEVWIADQPDLPTFTVQYKTSWRVTGSNEAGDHSIVYEIYDVNAPFTIEPPEGADQTGLPDDVPPYPGAQQLFSMEGMTSFSTTDSVADVAEFYREGLLAEGWTLDSEELLDTMAQQSWTKEARMLTLLVGAQDDGTSVSIYIDGAR